MIELERHLRVVRGIQQLPIIQFRIGPVAGADLLGLQETLPEQAGHRRLGANRTPMPVAPHRIAQIQDVGKFDAEAAPQDAPVIPQPHADLEYCRILQHCADHRQRRCHRRREKIGPLRRCQLDKMRPGRHLAFEEGRFRFRIESEHRTFGQFSLHLGGFSGIVDQYDIGERNARVNRQTGNLRGHLTATRIFEAFWFIILADSTVSLVFSSKRKCMGKTAPQGFFARLRARWMASAEPPSVNARARQLIAAIDRGGVPLNTARVNAIARDLGLDVSRKAAVEDTIDRIRLALTRVAEHD